MPGVPGAARAVGNIMRTCGRPDVPCHRVIAAGGRLGGYGGSEVLKRQLLMSEGVVFHGTRVKAGHSANRAGPFDSSGQGNGSKGRSRLRKRR